MRSINSGVAVTLAVLLLLSCSKSEAPPGRPPGATASTKVPLSDLHPCKATATDLTTDDCQAAQYWMDQAKKGTADVSAPSWMLQGQTRTVTLAVGTQAPAQDATAIVSSNPPPVAAAAPTPVAEASAPAAEDPAKPKSGQKPPVGDATKEVRHERLIVKEEAPQTPREVAIEASDKKNSQVAEYHPLVGKQLSANIESLDFDIHPLSPAVQQLTDSSVTTWEWEITAKHFGSDSKFFIKTAVAMIDSQGNTVLLSPSTEVHKVNVWIGPSGILDTLNAFPDWLKIIGTILGGVAGVIAAWKGVKAAIKGKGESKTTDQADESK
ncbi:MAG TPA: hypothetical protein VIF60_17850 [Burkholderiaceae bacterium]|jgi:hypothetical protein